MVFSADDTGIGARKAQLRLQMRAVRAALPPPQRAEASTRVCGHLWRWLEQEWLPRFPEMPIGVYLALPPEPSLDELIGGLLQRGVPLAAPRVDTGRGAIAMHQLDGLDKVEYGPWNVRQPPAQSPVVAVTLALVPGLAFDARGGRLGMGGGWYDRLLPDVPVALGVAFACQRVDAVPQEAHDRHLHGLFTESGEEMFLPLPHPGTPM